jgi:hypothetical protein
MWQRVSSDPIMQPQSGTLLSEAVTTPDLILWRNHLRLYVGAVSGGSERIVTFPLEPAQLRAGAPIAIPDDLPAAIDTGPSRFDSLHVFDPAAIVVDDQVFLYYSAVGPDGDTLGLATSADGISFSKRDSSLLEGRAPEVIRSGGSFHLFYVLQKPGQSYAIFSAVSDDGESFSAVGDGPVLDTGQAGAWDSFEVTTPRLFERNGVSYMLYAGEGDPARKDIPRAFGLARSQDLRNWERYPGNPVFHCGPPGAWDDGAIWFGTVFYWDDTLYLMYEGGAASNLQASGPPLTQVGLASVLCEEFDTRMASWPLG